MPRRKDLIAPWPLTALLLGCVPIAVGCHDFEDALGESRSPIAAGANLPALDADFHAATVDQVSMVVLNEEAPKGKPPAFGPLETAIWRVRIHLVSVQILDNGDYCLEGESGSKRPAVAVLPDPKRVQDPVMADRVAKAREELVRQLHPTTQRQEIDKLVVLDGFGRPGLVGGPNGKSVVVPVFEPTVLIKWDAFVSR